MQLQFLSTVPTVKLELNVYLPIFMLMFFNVPKDLVPLNRS